MHQSFTGNTRKARQVNLSGRKTADPWAALPSSVRTPQTAQGTQSTIAHAQADRLRRQQERERLQATKRLQKLWRGYSCRRQLRLTWKHEWDQREQQRRGQSTRIDYGHASSSSRNTPPYSSPAQLSSQLHLLLRCQHFNGERVRDSEDSARLVYFGMAVKETMSQSKAKGSDVAPEQWSRLVIVVIKHIRSMTLATDSPDRDTCLARLVKMLESLNSIAPVAVSTNAPACFAVLHAALSQNPTDLVQETISDSIITMFKQRVSTVQILYAAFVDQFLSSALILDSRELLDYLASNLDPEFLTTSMTSIEPENSQSFLRVEQNRDAGLWQLAYAIWLRDRSLAISSVTQKRQTEWLQVIAILLGRCANDIARRLPVTDSPMDELDEGLQHPLPSFIREQVKTLVSRTSVEKSVQLLSKSHDESGTRKEVADLDSAKKMANYAVGLFRAFPDQAPRISKWLYECSSRSVGQESTSVVQYFWINARRTNVFSKISLSHRNVLSILREPFPDSKQINHPPPSTQDFALWRDEWRIILLFLELYTFVLASMDDEEFFALGDDGAGKFGKITTVDQVKGAIQLREVGLMTTFLKNLAFTLYWNAADLVQSNEPPNSSTLSAIFGNTQSTELISPVRSRANLTLTGNEVTQKYLKDLVTRLLIMLHERDTRRKFLPENHWLMTSQVDLAGFIPAVVAEEEKRHEHAESDADETDEEDLEVGDNSGSNQEVAGSSTLLRSFFGVREPHTPRSRLSQHMEAIQRRQEQSKRKRQLESLVPRLEILRNLPFFIPFETRVQIFREFIHHDQVRRRDGYVDPDIWRMSIEASAQARGVEGRPLAMDVISRHQAEIHRTSVFEDAYANFYDLGEGLKEPIQISFIDRFGAPEAGIDGGGVTKEFLISVTSESLEPSSPSSLFQENEQRYLYPNPTIFDQAAYRLRQKGYRQGKDDFRQHMRELLRRFEFLGRIVGKCIYEGILIDVNFAGFFLLKWAMSGGTTAASNETASRASVNDLRDFDEALYQGLLKLKNYTGDVESDFALNFTVTDSFPLDTDGKGPVHNITRELMTNGANVSVTNSNRQDYVDRIVRYRLHRQPEFVTNAFLKGLGQIIPPMWLAMFNQKELQKLVGGDNAELDIADLRRNTQYGGLYVIGDDGLEHPTVQLFWKALKEMSDPDRRRVLKFVTSTPRAPLLGFSHLNPKFSIRDSSEDQSRLPSTSTCVNLLKLPRYGDLRTMKEKLLYAVNSGAGFDLS